MLGQRQHVQLRLRGHRVDWADLPGGHRGVGHPGLRGLSLQEQRQLLGVLQHSNTALYEKPDDLSVGCIQDTSVPGIKLREEVRSSPWMADSQGLQLEQLLLVSSSLA